VRVWRFSGITATPLRYYGRRRFAALGGGLGIVAVLIKQEVLLAFIGGVYVIEALSVILQVGSYKLRNGNVFQMAPIHHHLRRWVGLNRK